MKMNRLENVWKTNGTNPNINSIQFHWQQIFFLKIHKKKNNSILLDFLSLNLSPTLTDYEFTALRICFWFF